MHPPTPREGAWGEWLGCGVYSGTEPFKGDLLHHLAAWCSAEPTPCPWSQARLWTWWCPGVAGTSSHLGPRLPSWPSPPPGSRWGSTQCPWRSCYTHLCTRSAERTSSREKAALGIVREASGSGNATQKKWKQLFPHALASRLSFGVLPGTGNEKKQVGCERALYNAQGNLGHAFPRLVEFCFVDFDHKLGFLFNFTGNFASLSSLHPIQPGYFWP